MSHKMKNNRLWKNYIMSTRQSKRALRVVALSVLLTTHAFAGVVPVPEPFHAGQEQTDARMIYVGGSGSGGRLAVDNHAEFMLARDDSNVALNWCNAGTFKWSFGFFSFDGPRSEYPQFQADVNGSPAVTFDGKDKFRMILEPGYGYTLLFDRQSGPREPGKGESLRQGDESGQGVAPPDVRKNERLEQGIWS